MAGHCNRSMKLDDTGSGLSQAVVDVGDGNGGFGRRHDHLIESAHEIPCSIQTGDRRLLMFVNEETTVAVASGAQRCRQATSGHATERRIDDLESPSGPFRGLPSQVVLFNVHLIEASAKELDSGGFICT